LTSDAVRALDIVACLSFFACFVSSASGRAHASAISASLCKTKSRADITSAPVVATVGTAMAPSTAADGSHVATDCGCVVAVTVREGHTYSVEGGSDVAVEGGSGAVVAKVKTPVRASVSVESLEPSSREASSMVACWVHLGDLRN
jgi:anti-sigma factor RsiW